LKKFAAIFLILVLWVNWYGYRFITDHIQRQSDKNLEVKLDKNDYDESQLYEIRIPLNMPYQNNSSEYERHYGEINIDGKTYTYVKRKVVDGFLVLKCIYNTGKQEIQKMNADLFKMTNGLDQNQDGKKQIPGNFFKNLLSEYDDQASQINFSVLSLSDKKYDLSNNTMLLQGCSFTPYQPPESVEAISG